MGDQGRLYVTEDVVPAYKRLLREADLILPNQFEAEVLSGIKITSLDTLKNAIATLHREHRIPHIIVTSVSFDASSPTLSVVGSTRRTDGTPRFFRIDIPRIDCFFSGTGDMFAALTVVRLREAAVAANLEKTTSWMSPDGVEASELPLAKAVEKVLASMHAVLRKTKTAMDETLKGMEGGALDMESASEAQRHLRKTKAAEVRLVRNLDDLRHPLVHNFKAKALETEAEWTPTRPFDSGS